MKAYVMDAATVCPVEIASMRCENLVLVICPDEFGNLYSIEKILTWKRAGEV
jgi:hypothetical protein